MSEIVKPSLGVSPLALPSNPPGACPRHARRVGLNTPGTLSRPILFADLHREPFRLFFPFATFAGLVGVALWPALFLGWISDYPGPSHIRLMIQGLFGGYIFGFLGTALPKLLEVKPISSAEAFSLLVLMVSNVVASIAGNHVLADTLFLAEVLLWLGVLMLRFSQRKCMPPPSFVLVGLAFLSAIIGTVLQIAARFVEVTAFAAAMGRLLSFHAFVLLCVLGAGGFLLPRFLGLGVRRKYVESKATTPEWNWAACVAMGIGALLFLSYAVEAMGWVRTAGLFRTVLMLGYLLYEMPLEKLRWRWQGVQWLLVLGLACIPLGIFAAAFLPGMTATWLHLELIGGFGLITFGVATRVVFGHSGFRQKLERFHPGFTAAGVLMVLGLLSRLSGDFLPGDQQVRHYIYGAVAWILGGILWLTLIFPKLGRADTAE